MARKSLVVLTSAIGVAAVAIGAYVARHRRDGYAAKTDVGDWHDETSLAEELEDLREEPVAS